MKNRIIQGIILSIMLIFSCKTQNSGEGQDSKNVDLKLLRVYYAGEVILNKNDPNEIEVVTTKDIISNQNILRVKVETKSETAKIYFDGSVKPSNTNIETYQATPLDDKVRIKVEDGNGASKKTKTYIINVNEGGTDKISADLKFLKVYYGDEVILHKTDVNTSENVKTSGAISGQYKLKVEVATRSKTAKTYFDGGGTSQLASVYDATPKRGKVKIKVEDGRGTSKIVKEYTVDVEEGSSTLNANLKMLKIFFDGALVLDKEAVEAEESITILENIAIDNELKVMVKAKSLTAKVYFDNDASHSLSKIYTSSPNEHKIIIKVEDEGNTPGSEPKQTRTYVINVTEDVLGGVEPNNTIKCNVTNFVGGVNVENADVKVFKAGKSVSIVSDKTNSNGDVFFKLPRGRYYDFVVTKDGSSSSRVENVYIEKGTGMQVLPIVQRGGSVGKKPIAPRITRIEHFVRATKNSQMSSLEDVINQYELNSNEENRRFGGFLVTVVSDSGEIIPERIGTGLNYGIGMNIGGKFSTQQLESHYFPIFVSDSDGKTIHRDSVTGAVTQRMVFDLSEVSFPTDENGIIYIIAYDMAGNRCERHLNVRLTHDDEIAETKDVKISAFKVLFERFMGELNTFGLNGHDGLGTSYKTTISFAFDRENVKISALDIYRREYTGQADVNVDWQRVDRRVFKEPKLVAKGSFFNEADNSLTPEEGKTYQYKVTAYLNVNGKLEEVNSSIGTAKILPAFNIKLLYPSSNEEVELNYILQNGMKFKISNIECWKPENADYFVFGVLILSDEHLGSSGKADEADKDNKQEKGARFASHLRYNFNKTGNEVLEVMDSSNKWNSITGNLADIFDCTGDTITLKKDFFDNGMYNLIEGKKLSEVLKTGEMYYWDIQDWGKSALSVRDDSPAYFIKEWEIKDSKTGEVLQNQKSFAVSAGNLLKGSSAINGRVPFTIK